MLPFSTINIVRIVDVLPMEEVGILSYNKAEPLLSLCANHFPITLLIMNGFLSLYFPPLHRYPYLVHHCYSLHCSTVWYIRLLMYTGISLLMYIGISLLT